MEDAAIALEGAAFSNNGHPSTYRIPPFRASSPALDTSQPRSKPKELTRALTCIMDEGITVTDDARAPLAAAQMGLDIDCSAAELPRLRREAIARAAAVLPQSKEESWRGVRKYLEEVNWMSSILHPEALEAEVEFYWHLKEQGRDEEVCPIWLAMYAQVRLIFSSQWQWLTSKLGRNRRSSPLLSTSHSLILLPLPSLQVSTWPKRSSSKQRHSVSSRSANGGAGPSSGRCWSSSSSINSNNQALETDMPPRASSPISRALYECCNSWGIISWDPTTRRCHLMIRRFRPGRIL